MSDNLIQMYKSVKVKDMETKYEPRLFSSIQSIVCKQQQQQQHIDINNNNVASSQSSASAVAPVKITMAIHQELSDYRAKSLLCKEKLSQQKQLIQSLLNKIGAAATAIQSGRSVPVTGSAAAASANPNRTTSDEHNHNYVVSETNSTTSSSCTSNSSSFQTNQRLNGENNPVSHVSQSFNLTKSPFRH